MLKMFADHYNPQQKRGCHTYFEDYLYVCVCVCLWRRSSLTGALTWKRFLLLEASFITMVLSYVWWILV